MSSNAINKNSTDKEREAFDLRQEELKREMDQQAATERQENLRQSLELRRNHYRMTYFHWVILIIMSFSLLIFSSLLFLSYIPDTKFIVRYFFASFL